MRGKENFNNFFRSEKTKRLFGKKIDFKLFFDFQPILVFFV